MGSHRGATEDMMGSHRGATEDVRGSHRGATEDVMGSHRRATEDMMGGHRGATEGVRDSSPKKEKMPWIRRFVSAYLQNWRRVLAGHSPSACCTQKKRSVARRHLRELIQLPRWRAATHQ